MSEVFLSYRQTDDEQKERVRAFGERLRDSSVDVVLDQFFLDANPGGPNDGWPKWSSDRALDTQHIPGKLRPYHRFHAERDFSELVRWLGGKIAIDDTPHTSIPHNLPSLQPFFGREEELKKIAEALDPESRTWGRLDRWSRGDGQNLARCPCCLRCTARCF